MWILVMLVAAIISQVPFLNVAMTMGLYYVALRKLKGQQQIDFGDLFKGFDGHYFLQGLLYMIVSGLIVFAAAAVAFIPFLIIGLVLSKVSGGVGGVFMILGYLAAVVVGIVASVLWIFAGPLIIDKRMTFWDAMMASKDKVLQNLGGYVGFAIVAGLVYLLGAIICGVGILVTAPIVIVAMVIAYRDNFGLEPEAGVAAAAPPMAPPPPVPPVQ